MTQLGTFEAFDPLDRRRADHSRAAQKAELREISNILSSYVGWYDPFCELIQNALDAVDKRREHEAQMGVPYEPRIHVLVDLVENRLTVSDNGIGMDREQFELFLTPNYSFKDEKLNRGHKGVGATYLAYGFNSLRVHTKSPGFEVVGAIVSARNWVEGLVETDPPKVEPDTNPDADSRFESVDRGTSITVRLDKSTYPTTLAWLGATDAETWLQILRVKTAIGAVVPESGVHVDVTCVGTAATTTATTPGVGYLWLHEVTRKKSARLRDVQASRLKAFDAGKAMPARYTNLHFLHDVWTAAEVKAVVDEGAPEGSHEIVAKYEPTVRMEYGYSARIWRTANEQLQIRQGQQVFRPGIQLAANDMPQGDVIAVPLRRYIGRQNQVHFLIHFENYTPDLGRKGFAKSLVEFAEWLSVTIIQNHVAACAKAALKHDSGAQVDLQRAVDLSQWKKEMLLHEEVSPLVLSSPHFFHPTQKISILSTPTREQDVIALFHELLSGGVVRGINVLATNERLTYDGLFKLGYGSDRDLYVFDAVKNPLGVSEANADALLGMTLPDPRVLEYKFSVDGLMNDLATGDKNINEMDLCVAWDLGTDYQEHYRVTTVLVPENLDSRQHHGVTHVLQDADNGAPMCQLIILKDLVQYLTNPEATIATQRDLFE